MTTMSNYWKFWMHGIDGPNQLHAAMFHLDHEMGPYNQVCEFGYGMQIDEGGACTLKGYICFFNALDESNVNIYLDGFYVAPINRLDIIEIRTFLSEHSYWTKFGMRQFH